MSERRPPRRVAAALARFLAPDRRDEILGDLEEEFRRRGSGVVASAWYVWEAFYLGLHCAAAAGGTDLVHDLRMAVRQLRSDPGFTVVAITALSLGIGVNATILSVADEVLFAPLPYPDEERLAILTNDHTGSTTGGFGVSWPNMQDVRQASRTLEDTALYLDWQDLTYRGEDAAVRIPAAFVDTGYFRLLGLRALRGRLISDAENGAGDHRQVAVLSRGTWERVFGADPGIIGRVVRLDDRPYEVVGVLADDRGDLRYRWGEAPAGIFLPLFAAEDLLGFDLDGRRGQRVLNALVLLAPGASLEAAQAELESLSAELAREYPRTGEGWAYRAQALDEAFFETLQAPTRALLAGSVLVLLLVSVNLVNLVLIRASGRRRAMAMRRVLGARSWRLFRQLLTESLLLSFLAGALGLLLAAWGIAYLAGSGVLALPSFAVVELGAGIVVVSALLTLAAGLVLGVAGSVGILGASTGAALRDHGRSSGGPRGARARNVLVAAEVALAFVLLVGAGLMVASFEELRDTGTGFDTDNLLLGRIDVRGQDDGPERLRALATELAERGAALPGVEDAFVWSPNRLGHGNQVEILTAAGRWRDHPEERVEASLHAVHPGTLARLGIPLLRGRDVRRADVADGPRVALVSEALAAEVWPGEDPLGRRFETMDGDELVQVEVVGVMADARHRTRLIDPFGPQRDVYYPFAQSTWRSQTLALRYGDGVDPTGLAAALRGLVAEIDPGLPVYEVSTMAANLREEEAGARLTAFLVGVYAVLAVALAGLGLYGVLAHAVRRRRREIGIRMALGARDGQIRRAVVGRGLVPVVIGGVLGAAGALLATRALAGALYGVSILDPAIWIAVPLLLTAVALAALWIPARRASHTDPVTVLRVD